MPHLCILQQLNFRPCISDPPSSFPSFFVKCLAFTLGQWTCDEGFFKNVPNNWPIMSCLLTCLSYQHPQRRDFLNSNTSIVCPVELSVHVLKSCFPSKEFCNSGRGLSAARRLQATPLLQTSLFPIP